MSGSALLRVFSGPAACVLGFLLLVTAAGWFWLGPDRDLGGAEHLDHAVIRNLRSDPEPTAITLDRILVSDAAMVCIIAPYFDLALHDSPHGALIRRMDRDFSHDGVVRVGLFDPAGGMLADLSLPRRMVDVEPGFRSDCRPPGHILVQRDGDRSKVMVLQRRP